MERKIGEIFENNGEWYQCIVGCHCLDCAFYNNNCEEMERITLGNKLTKEETTGFCTPEFREDGKSVIFKKLKKVGEPFTSAGKLCQHYKVFDIDNVCGDGFWCTYDYKTKTLTIEIKQNKEDMEESKLKPFNLEQAKAGKPVCTKDGRKARIICFDRNDLYPIVALIECEDGKEIIGAYSKEGKTEIYEIKGTDLMMLPEKKEGWVNIYRSQIYDTLERAKEAYKRTCNDNNYLKTIKIEWEE